MAKVTVSFTLDSEADRDLVRWLARFDRGAKSGAIREALRAGLERGGITLGDVYRAVKDLERKVQAGAVIVAQGDPPAGDEWDEPPEAAAALDALGEMG